MPRKKKTKYDQLREEVVSDLESRGALLQVDQHLIDHYITQYKIVDMLMAEIEAEGVVAEGERNREQVANPALVRLPAAQSQLLALAKQLGIGPYGRKLTTGQETKPKKEPTVVSQLRPRSRNKAN